MAFVGKRRGRGMKGVELYAQVRYAVQIEGLSRREAARRYGIDPRTVAKMLAFSVPPGYRRSRPPCVRSSTREGCRRRLGDRLRGHEETIGERLVRDLAAFHTLPASPYDACEKKTGRVSSLSLVRYHGT